MELRRKLRGRKKRGEGRILGDRKERDLAVLVSSGKATQEVKDGYWNSLPCNNFIINDYLQTSCGMMRLELDF